jgi:hypothetical protein
MTYGICRVAAHPYYPVSQLKDLLLRRLAGHSPPNYSDEETYP